MRVIFMGTPDFAVSSLDALIERGDEVLLVVSQEDKPRDRGKKVQPTPVKERASALGLPVYQPKSIKTDEAYEMLKQYDPEVIVVTAYGQIVPKRILELPKYGCINVHASLLPKYRGAAPIHYALIDGEEKTGITTMLMSEGLDTGDMLLTDELIIEESDNLESLHNKLAALSKKTLVNTLTLLERGQEKRIPQNEELSSYAPLIKKELGHIDFSRSPQDIFNLLRAVSGYAHMDGKTVKLFGVKEGNRSESEEYGKIVRVAKDHIEVIANGGTIRFFEIQMPNKKRMRVEDFLKGNSIEVSTILE